MTYRTKTKKVVKGDEYTWIREGIYVSDYSVYASNTWSTYSTEDGFQRITTESRPKSDPVTRNVTHRVRYGGLVPLSITWLNVVYPTDATRDYNGKHWGPAEYRLDSLLADPAEADVLAFNTQAFMAMRPSLEGDLSLTNFLLELRELPTLLKVFPQWIDRVYTLRDVTKVSSGFHLTYAFGIKPFVDDLSKIYDRLMNIESIIADFRKRQNTTQLRHFGYTSDPVVLHQSHLFSVDYDMATDLDIRYVDSWHATMKYTYNCPILDGWRGKIRAVREVLGLKLTQAKAWNATPWTFLFDWVVDVGGWLEKLNFETDAIPLDLEILDYGISFKRTVSNCTHKCNYPAVGGGRVKEVSYQGRGSVYWRRRMLPEIGSFSIDVGGLSANQLVLSASLLNLRK